MDAATYTKSGTKATTTTKLDKTVFGIVPENHTLVKLAYDAYLANGRSNYAVTKTRGLISGGGKKPWKQKGTGNARVGDNRTPLWRGGGTVFGPTGEENYTKQMNVKAKRQAIRQALSIAAEGKKVLVIQDFVAANGKTAEIVALLAKIGATRKILVVVAHKSDELLRASNNLQNVKLIQPKYVNVYDAMNSDSIVFTTDALAATTEWLIASPTEGTK
jgi:large subunit ribosomal protein L4